MTYNADTAEVEPRSQEEWLNLILEDGSQHWGEDITERDGTAIHQFYEPYAGRLAELEQQLQDIQHSLRVKDAEGQALDYLGERLGVKRRLEKHSAGQVTFLRDTVATKDYLVKSGTVVETGGDDSIQFETTEKITIEGPDTDTDSYTYSTTSGTYATQTSFTVDVSHRENLDVQADIRTTDGTVSSDLEIADATNATQLHTGTTTNTSFVTSGPSSYDVSGLDGEITIEYRLRSGDGATSVELTNSTLDKGGETGSSSAMEAAQAGSRGNVASGTITETPDSISGVDDIYNYNHTSGGRNKELDENYRERITISVGELDVTSGQHIYNVLSLLDYIEQIKYIDNSSDSMSDGLNAHEVEIIIDSESGHTDEIAQVIFNNMSMGANLVSGVHGTAETGTATLSNGQSFTIDYSIPTQVDIYVDASVTVENDLSKAEIKDAIVEYIGGVKSNGQQIYGELNVGDDVLYGEVDFSIRDLTGVYDVTSLDIDISSPPAGTSNISIASTERAEINASDITVTTSSK